MTRKPKLADVQCTSMQFQPGDRILVKSRHRLTQDERRKLQKIVERWAGDHVEVLVIDLPDMEIQIERADQRAIGIHQG